MDGPDIQDSFQLRIRGCRQIGRSFRRRPQSSNPQTTDTNPLPTRITQPYPDLHETQQSSDVPKVPANLLCSASLCEVPQMPQKNSPSQLQSGSKWGEMGRKSKISHSCPTVILSVAKNLKWSGSGVFLIARILVAVVKSAGHCGLEPETRDWWRM